MRHLELTPDVIMERLMTTSDYSHLGKKYQDWLCQKGLLERVPESSPVWSGLKGMKLRLEQQRSLLSPEILFLMLMGEEGNLVSLRRQAAVLYGMNFLGISSYEIGNVQQGLYALGTKLNQQTDTCGALFCGKGIGRSLGISALAIRASEFRILYALWKDSGWPVSHHALAGRLYGRDGENERNIVRVFISRIKKKNSLNIRNVRGFGYMLVDSGIKEDDMGSKIGW